MKTEFTMPVLMFLLLFVATMAWGQIGGNTTPLLYSTHTYTVTMGDAANSTLWQIYSGTLTVADVESGDYTPIDKNASPKIYKVVSYDVSSGIASFEVQFGDNITSGNYTLAYEENTSNSCYQTRILNFQLMDAIDVDVELVNSGDAAACPDSTGTAQYTSASQTTVEYRVYMVYPTSTLPYDSTWAFTATVTTQGSGGDNATIASITADEGGDGSIENTYTPAGSVSVYSVDYEVSSSDVFVVVFAVTYNDVLGVSQSITFELSGITGVYKEVDVDLVNGSSDGNSVSNTIYAMPDVGEIVALN